MSLPALALNCQDLLSLLHCRAILQFSIMSPSAVSFPSQKVLGTAACLPIEASPGNSTAHFCIFFSSQKGTDKQHRFKLQ